MYLSHLLKIVSGFFEMILLELYETDLIQNSRLVHVAAYFRIGLDRLCLHAVLYSFLVVLKGVVNTAQI